MRHAWPETRWSLATELTQDVLQLLGVQALSPTVQFLDQLVDAYVRRVPWESVFRIIKRNTHATSICARLPEEFWCDVLMYGGGGTCFENNFAFLALLRSLGYEGYMTVNDMNGRVGSHAAIIVTDDSDKYLVDVSIPIYASIRLDSSRPTQRRTKLHTFIASPCDRGRYQVERTRHPKRIAYTLIDRRVSDADFVNVIEKDYGATGQFLDRVIIVKMVDEELCRFSADDATPCLEYFGQNGKRVQDLERTFLIQTLADRFLMNTDKIGAAFSFTGHPL